MNKKSIDLILAGILSILFVLAVLIIPFNKSALSWIAFAFELIAILAQPVFVRVSFDGEIELRSKVYGFPIFRVGYTYLIGQSIFAIACFILDAFLGGNFWWIAAAGGIVALAYAAIGLIATSTAREIIHDIEEKETADTQFIKMLNMEAAAIKSLSAGKPFQKSVEQLSEKIRYSDPVSNEALKDDEGKISLAVSELKNAVASNTDVDINDMCKKIITMLESRNAAVKALKK